MPNATINGLPVHYETYGSGPPVLMFAPGGFDSTVVKWSTAGVWPGVRPLETLAQRYTCIAYDRREAGQSGGRVERLSWALYAEEGAGILDHLGIQRAFVMGGCMGCSVAIAFGVAYPERTLGMVLHWPVGGVRWRQTMRKRFEEHAAFAAQHGLEGVVRQAREKRSTFQQEATVGPWGHLVATDEVFARGFAAQDIDGYLALVRTLGPAMFDRDTSPGAEPEVLIALKTPAVIIPGDDPNHATSAAWYLQQCLPNAQYHDVPVKQQTGDEVRDWVLTFLDAHIGAVVR